MVSLLHCYPCRVIFKGITPHQTFVFFQLKVDYTCVLFSMKIPQIMRRIIFFIFSKVTWLKTDNEIMIYINRFMPPDDPLGRHGPSLENFLRKRPVVPEHKKQPCPYGKLSLNYLFKYSACTGNRNRNNVKGNTSVFILIYW